MKVSKQEFNQTVSEVNGIVSKHSKGSTLRGLEVAVTAFAALCDIYAAPNAENPQGMCDDKLAFRTHFAELLKAMPI